LTTARRFLGAAGTQTLALGFGGYTTAVSAATEQYDGSVWSNTTSMATARRNLGGAGTLQAGLGFGGYTTTSVANTEEFTSSINVTTAAAWASGGNLGTARALSSRRWNSNRRISIWWSYNSRNTFIFSNRRI
jgi:hypothetical protein